MWTLSKLTERASLWSYLEIAWWLAVAFALVWAGHTVILPVRVAGWSMHPALSVGDVVLVRLGARPVPGDVVLVRPAGRAPVLHRVVELLDNGAVRTKGDANLVADARTVPAADVLGRSVAVIPVGAIVDRWRARSACATMATQSNSDRQ